MDKKNIYPSGQTSVFMEEFSYVPDSNLKAIESISRGLGGSSSVNFILDGVNAVINLGANVEVESGHVVINGETLEVEAQTVSNTAGNNLYEFYKVQDLSQASGVRSFGDGSTKNIYEKNRAVVRSVSSYTGGAGTMPVNGETTLASSNKSGLITASQFDDIQTIGNRLEVLREGTVQNVAIGVSSIGASYSVTGDFASAEELTGNSSFSDLKVTFSSNITEGSYTVAIFNRESNNASAFLYYPVSYSFTSSKFQFLIAKTAGSVTFSFDIKIIKQLN